METILTDYSISISEFKKNPSSIMRDAGEKPVAVLSHNKPAFYMITPSLFEAMLEELSDRELVDIARHRLTLKNTAIEVDLDSI